MIGWMACSKAGHDKDKIYIIIEETDKYVWLADGDIRKADNPKRKSRKHIKVIKKTADEQLFANPACINETIKRAIKIYKQSLPIQDK